jgi:hypothetical protein
LNFPANKITGKVNPFNGVNIGLWSTPSFVDGDDDYDVIMGAFPFSG